MRVHKYILTTLTVLGGILLLYMVTYGYGYYTLDIAKRPLSTLHEILRPSGLYGHGYGIIGSSMLLLLLLYSVRKRAKWFPKIGKLSTWLNYHIFLGIMGPVLVTFHTSFKFGGIVAVSYWSMMIVMFSGFVGRYLYTKIPRSISGHELSLKEVQEDNKILTDRLRMEYNLAEETIHQIEQLGESDINRRSDLKTLLSFFLADLKRPFTLQSFYRKFRNESDVTRADYKVIKKIARQKMSIHRKLAALQTTHRFFHYWHVFHKPFAYIMLFIMVIHITVVVLFGYHWVF